MSMTGTQFIALARPRIGDSAKVIYDDDELLGYLNDGIEQVSLSRIEAKDPMMVTEVSVVPGTTAVPDGFTGFAGQYPVYFSGGKIVALDGTSTAKIVRYFAVKPRLTALSETLPFGDEAVPALLNYVIAAAAARVGANAETEGALAQRSNGALQNAGTGVGRAMNVGAVSKNA